MSLKGLKIELELHKRLKLAAAENGVPIQQIVERAVDVYLNRLAPLAATGAKGIKPSGNLDESPQNEIKSSGIQIRGPEIPWVKRTVNILRSKNQTFRRAIKYNLLSFGLIPESVRESASGRPSLSDAELDRAIRELEKQAAEIEADQAETGESPPKSGSRRKSA